MEPGSNIEAGPAPVAQVFEHVGRWAIHQTGTAWEKETEKAKRDQAGSAQLRRKLVFWLQWTTAHGRIVN